MSIESQEDFDGIQCVGRVVAETLRAMEREVQPGATTGELDEIGASMLKRNGTRVHVHRDRLDFKRRGIDHGCCWA